MPASPHEQLLQAMADWQAGSLADDALQQQIVVTAARLMLTANQMKQGLATGMSADLRQDGENALRTLERYNELLGEAGGAVAEERRDAMPELCSELNTQYEALVTLLERFEAVARPDPAGDRGHRIRTLIEGLPDTADALRAELASGLEALNTTEAGLEVATREHLQPLMALLRAGYDRALKALESNDQKRLREGIAMLSRAFEMAHLMGEDARAVGR